MDRELILNPELLKQQKVSKKNEALLYESHRIKADILKQMEQSNNPSVLKILAGMVESMECYQQMLWGFPVNRDFHYWWRVPKCQCPEMDNAERWGTKWRVISGACPVHGQELPVDKTEPSEVS